MKETIDTACEKHMKEWRSNLDKQIDESLVRAQDDLDKMHERHDKLMRRRKFWKPVYNFFTNTVNSLLIFMLPIVGLFLLIKAAYDENALPGLYVAFFFVALIIAGSALRETIQMSTRKALDEYFQETVHNVTIRLLEQQNEELKAKLKEKEETKE